MKKLYKFYWDCGRLGDVESIFIAEEDDVKSAIGKEVYFGEILGKHSEVYGDLEKEDFEELKVSNETIEELAEVIGDTISGYNPLKYLDLYAEEDDCDDDNYE